MVKQAPQSKPERTMVRASRPTTKSPKTNGHTDGM